MSRYDRANLQPVVSRKDGSQTRDFLSGAQTRFTANLVFSRTHIVTPDEEGRADLIAYRELGQVELWWVIGYYNGLIAPQNELFPGRAVRIPTLTSVEDYLRNVKTNINSGKVVTLK